MDILRLEFLVHNGSERWLDQLIALFDTVPVLPECTNWGCTRSGPVRVSDRVRSLERGHSRERSQRGGTRPLVAPLVLLLLLVRLSVREKERGIEAAPISGQRWGRGKRAKLHRWITPTSCPCRTRPEYRLKYFRSLCPIPVLQTSSCVVRTRQHNSLGLGYVTTGTRRMYDARRTTTERAGSASR